MFKNKVLIIGSVYCLLRFPEEILLMEILVYVNSATDLAVQNKILCSHSETSNVIMSSKKINSKEAFRNLKKNEAFENINYLDENDLFGKESKNTKLKFLTYVIQTFNKNLQHHVESLESMIKINPLELSSKKESVVLRDLLTVDYDDCSKNLFYEHYPLNIRTVNTSKSSSIPKTTELINVEESDKTVASLEETLKVPALKKSKINKKIVLIKFVYFNVQFIDSAHDRFSGEILIKASWTDNEVKMTFQFFFFSF